MLFLAADFLAPKNLVLKQKKSEEEWEDWGYTRSCEGTGPGQWTQTGQRDISLHTVSHSTMNIGVKKDEGRFWERWCLSSQENHYPWGAPLSWKWLDICLLMGSNECFALFMHVAFALPQSMNFHTFTFPILFSHPIWREWVSSWVMLGWIKLQQFPI